VHTRADDGSTRAPSTIPCESTKCRRQQIVITDDVKVQCIYRRLFRQHVPTVLGRMQRDTCQRERHPRDMLCYWIARILDSTPASVGSDRKGGRIILPEHQAPCNSTCSYPAEHWLTFSPRTAASHGVWLADGQKPLVGLGIGLVRSFSGLGFGLGFGQMSI
jgi:hypothetical protein